MNSAKKATGNAAAGLNPSAIMNSAKKAAGNAAAGINTKALTNAAGSVLTRASNNAKNNAKNNVPAATNAKGSTPSNKGNTASAVNNLTKILKEADPLVVAQVLARNGQNIIAAAAAKVGNSNGANGKVVEEETQKAPNAKKILGKNGVPEEIPEETPAEEEAPTEEAPAEEAPAEEAPAEEAAAPEPTPVSGGRRRTRRRHAKKSKKSRKAKKSKKGSKRRQ